MTDNLIGVYASFSINPRENDEEKMVRERKENEFKEYLWGKDREGGLSKHLKEIGSTQYGKDLKKILLQFSVNPVPEWPQPTKEVENYRPNERSIGVWITIDDDNFFSKDEKHRQEYIKREVLDRLLEIKKRFATRKLDSDIDKLIADIGKLLV